MLVSNAKIRNPKIIAHNLHRIKVVLVNNNMHSRAAEKFEEDSSASLGRKQSA